MLRIAICDKDKKQQLEILDYIARDTEIGDDYTTECFDNTRVIKARLECQDFNFDLLFLGVDATGRTGIPLAAYLRKHRVDIDIIFMAANLDYIAEGFRYKAFNYIVKPITYERFCYEMSQYLGEKQEYQNEYLSVMVHGKEQMISLKTISYFTSDARRIGAVSNYMKDVVWFYGKLSELESKLSDYGFLRCHQSYLVNLQKVEGITGEQIQIRRNTLPISRKYSTDVKVAWEKFRMLHSIQGAVKKAGNKNEGLNTKYCAQMDSIDKNPTVIVTRSYAMCMAKYGMVIGVRGERRYDTFRLYQGEEMVLGRDEKQSQIILNNSTVSRKHCGIRFDENEQCYYVCDYSSNGTFIGSCQRLMKNKWVKVERDTMVQLTNDDCAFLLA